MQPDMERMSISFERRSLDGPQTRGVFQYEVEHLSWRAVGGPYRARIIATAGGPDPVGSLWRLCDLLRCPLTVHQGGAPVWWGFLNAVEVRAGRRWGRASLDNLCNRAAVRYLENAPERYLAERVTTGWESDPASLALYGERANIYAGGTSSAAQAEALRSYYLKRSAHPRMLMRQVHGGRSSSGGSCFDEPAFAVLEGLGWWQTLNWRYYSEPRGRMAHTAAGALTPLGTPGVQKLAQKISIAAGEGWQAVSLFIRAGSYLATDNLTVFIYTNNNGSPGAPLGGWSKAGAAMARESEWVGGPLNLPVTLAAGGEYWLVVARSADPNAGQYFRAAVDEQMLYAGGTCLVHNGTGWAPRVPGAGLLFALFGQEDSVSQIGRMLGSAAGGQFLSGWGADCGGVPAALYRDGSRGAGDEIEDLLRAGSSSGERLLAAVDAERWVYVREQPAESEAKCMLGRDGRLRRIDGQQLRLQEQPAGNWVRLIDLSPAGGLTAPDGAVFVEGAQYEQGELTIRTEETDESN